MYFLFHGSVNTYYNPVYSPVRFIGSAVVLFHDP
jgi:hypothetical protein